MLIAGGSSDGAPQQTADLFLPAEFPDPYLYGMGHFGPTGSMGAPRVGAVAAAHIEGYAVAMGGGAPMPRSIASRRSRQTRTTTRQESGR